MRACQGQVFRRIITGSRLREMIMHATLRYPVALPCGFSRGLDTHRDHDPPGALLMPPGQRREA